jgi:hypothetical protein
MGWAATPSSPFASGFGDVVLYSLVDAGEYVAVVSDFTSMIEISFIGGGDGEFSDLVGVSAMVKSFD